MICNHGDGTHSAKLANEDYTYQNEFTINFEGRNGKFCGSDTGKVTKFADINGDSI